MANDHSEPAREAVARIIDPKSWEAYDHAYSMQVGEFRRFADRVVKPSLATAGAVIEHLSASPAPAASGNIQELASASVQPEPSSVEAVADLIDKLAKCRSENAMDQAFLDNSDEIATAVLKLIADRDGEWACTVNRLEDRIEGLNADLDSAASEGR